MIAPTRSAIKQHYQTYPSPSVAWTDLETRFPWLKKRQISQYLESPLKNGACGTTDRNLNCIDEGCGGGLHTAGSGILVDAQMLTEYLRKNAHLDGITSHDHCGAAALYVDQPGQKPTTALEAAKDWSSQLSRNLNLPCRHISLEAMWRPPTFHIARTVVYDGTASFNWTNLPELLPPAFITSRGVLPANAAQLDLQIACDIIVGGHGFGDLITSESPIHLILLAHTKPELERFSQEVNHVQLQFAERLETEGIIVS